MAEPLTFTAYTELALARLYEAERDGGDGPVDVRELMSDLEEVVPERWSWDAAIYIVDQGLGHDFLTMQAAHTALTAKGRIFVERREGSGIIEEYFKSPQIVVVTGDQNQVAVGHGQQVHQAAQTALSKEEAVGLLDEAEARLARDETLDSDERADALADVRSIRAQLEKKAPNPYVLRALVTGLSGLASIADIADKLHGLF